MGTEVKLVAVKAVISGNLGGGGCGRVPGAEHVEGELGGREEKVPKVRGKCDVGGGEAGDEMVFCCADGTFSFQ